MDGVDIPWCGPRLLLGRAAAWDVTRGWFAKWASFVLALIFSKFVVVLVFLVVYQQSDDNAERLANQAFFSSASTKEECG